MAILSDVEMYSIDGVEIPVYPTSVEASDNLVSKSWNDMTATFNDIPVALKAKVNWIFEIVSSDDLKKLYGQMIRNKIVTTGSRFFEINTDFPGVGFISGKFYIGAPTSFTSVGAGYGNGKAPHWRVELHWIEVDGIKLNSPISYENVALVNGEEVPIDELDDALQEG